MLRRTLARVVKSPPVQRLRRARLAYKARHGGQPDWRLSASEAKEFAAARAAASGPRVLIATTTGLHFAASRMDTMLAVALTLRGARVDILLCDAALPACMIGDSRWFPNPSTYASIGPKRDFCPSCYAPAAEAWAKLGFQPVRMSKLLAGTDRVAAKAWADEAGGNPDVLRNDAVAGHALAGALRFFARASLPKTPPARSILRQFLVAARTANVAAGALLDQTQYDVVVLHHGIYTPQGPILAAARSRSVRVVTWNPGYRTGCFLFSHGDSYHHTMISEPADRWSGTVLSAGWRKALERYLHSRRTGENDWIVFNQARAFSGRDYLAKRGIDAEKPVFLALTNVAWDAQLHYPDNAFRSMEEWLVNTVRWFAAHDDLELVIRIHPGETKSEPRAMERAEGMLRATFAELPPNVTLVLPDDDISTYALIEASRGVIIYATKTGIEASAMGKPVVVAGEAWIRGKDFSRDARDPAHYRELLAGLVDAPELTEAERERALRYAFHYFFRRMIPVRAAEPRKGWPPFAFRTAGLAPYRPGADPGLDLIADGILTGTPFELAAEDRNPAELLPGLAERAA